MLIEIWPDAFYLQLRLRLWSMSAVACLPTAPIFFDSHSQTPPVRSAAPTGNSVQARFFGSGPPKRRPRRGPHFVPHCRRARPSRRTSIRRRRPGENELIFHMRPVRRLEAGKSGIRAVVHSAESWVVEPVDMCDMRARNADARARNRKRTPHWNQIEAPIGRPPALGARRRMTMAGRAFSSRMLV
jgi:hypothetical protein